MALVHGATGVIKQTLLCILYHNTRINCVLFLVYFSDEIDAVDLEIRLK